MGGLQRMALMDHDLEAFSVAVGSVTHFVDRAVRGTEPIRGTFTVAFNGYETPALPFDVSATQLQQELNNLDSIDMVQVTRTKVLADRSAHADRDDDDAVLDDDDISGYGEADDMLRNVSYHYGAYAWSVTFLNVMGDVPAFRRYVPQTYL